MASGTGWELVAEVASESEPGLQHQIKRRATDGHLGCDCTSYRFARGSAKTCKHIEAFMASGAIPEWKREIARVQALLAGQDPLMRHVRDGMAAGLLKALSLLGEGGPWPAKPSDALRATARGESFTVRRAITFGEVG